MPSGVCCICGRRAHRSNPRSFFQIPNLNNGRLSDIDKSILKRRREAWLSLIGEHFNKYNGNVCVCSDHFQSGRSNVTFCLISSCFILTYFLTGKPAYLYMEHDVDWMPSKNLEGIGIITNNEIIKQSK